MHTLRAFLLTRHWRDTTDGLELSLWAASEHGPLRIVLDGEEAVCFVEREAAPGNDSLASLPCRRRALAKQCKLDEETVLTTVHETATCAPAAIAAAREECRDHDEYRDRETMEKRIDAVIRAAEKYARVMGVIPGGKPQGRASAQKKKAGADIAD